MSSSATKRNVQTSLAAVKLGIFVLVSVIVTGTLTAIMGSFAFGSETEYKAEFTSASLIQKGDDVRVAGVTVGSVKDVEIKDRDSAEVTFKVKKDVPLTSATRASIRFLNLVGDRYLALEQGRPGARKLGDGGVIPMSRTTPALNLTELFNGFQPLFQALTPSEVNQLSMNLVKVLQGEGGTIGSLMSNTASLTNALADRDQLIGRVIDNLSAMLKTVDDRHSQLTQLVVQLKDWMTNLSHDREAIGASVSNLSSLIGEMAHLLTLGRPYLKGDVTQLRRVMRYLNKPSQQAALDEVLNRLPVMLARQARTGTYGSWYQYYLCDFDGTIILPSFDGLPNPLRGQVESLLAPIQAKLKNISFYSTAKRCES
jgi:phospholipid/cholesterol/gamma-HCH transport system substrate-binding protein